MNSKPDFNEYSTIVFYGLDNGHDKLADAFETLVDWFQAENLSLDKLKVRGPGFSGKLNNFDSTAKKARTNGFSNMSLFAIYSIAHEYETVLQDWVATSSVRLDHENYCVVSAGSKILNMRSKKTFKLLSDLASSLRPAYGIVYFMERMQGPTLYAIGLNYASSIDAAVAQTQEKENITKWGDIGMTDEVYRMGLMRGLYPYNFLNETQLNMPVGEYSLKEWISKDPQRRGQLSEFGELTLWKIGDLHIAKIGHELRKHNVIFDWKVYRKQK